jgi:hypothetical protein
MAQDTTETGQARIDTTQPTGGAIDTTEFDTSSVTDTSGLTDTSAVTDTSALRDTSAVRDTTDTAGVQNPPGYRGMERDTTLFPPKQEGAADSAAHEGMEHGTGAGDTTAGTPDSAQ